MIPLVAVLGSAALQIGSALLVKLFSERFVSRGVVLVLGKLAGKTQTEWDNELVGYIRDEISPDMQLEKPQNWVVHESTTTLVLPDSNRRQNIVERKGAM